MKKFDISVLGMGYIGIPTAIIFASCGKKVLGVDVLENRVNAINSGLSHVGEADIDSLLKDLVEQKRFRAALKPESSDYYVVAVPTPFKKCDGTCKLPDLSYVEAATRAIAPCLENGQMLILESTSPVGTTRKMQVWLADELEKIGRAGDVDYNSVMFVHCPERILPGQMLKELVENDRIVGGMTLEAAEKAKELYSVFCRGEIFITDDKTAELAKLTENASRDVQIAFANELSIICDKLEINVWELIHLVNRHPRVNILNPGPGVGGHCIAVDPWFIAADAKDETPLIQTARRVNDSKPDFVLNKVFDAIASLGKNNVNLACLGITFKANVNDIRESPALKIAETLAASGKCNVIVADPQIETLPNSLKAAKKESIFDAVENADIVLLLVDHREFATISAAQLKGKLVIDTKGFFHQTRLGKFA